MIDVIYVVKVNNGYGEFEFYPFSSLNSAKNFARDILDEYLCTMTVLMMNRKN